MVNDAAANSSSAESTSSTEVGQLAHGPYSFAGRVLPERAHAYFHIPKRKARLPDREVAISVFCFGSQFTGSISSDTPFDNLRHAAAVIILMLRNVVDRLSFLFMCGYDVEVTSITAGEDHEILGVYEPVFFDEPGQQGSFARKELPSFSPIEMTPHHVRLEHAFRCFNHALRDDALTTFFCYLAIETTARMIAETMDCKPVERVDKKVWAIFREALRIQQSTIENSVKELADRFRHGDFINTSWEQRKRALSLTWLIIQRAIHFLGSHNSLSAERFEWL